MIDIGALTRCVLVALRQESGQLIGDGVAPEGCGWISGQPNVSAFVPYGVVSFTGASNPDQALRYAEAIRTWDTTWRLSCYGGSREQCDWVAALVRAGVEDCLNQEFGAYRVSYAWWRSLGSMTRSDVTDPPMWSVTDAFVLRCDS